MVADFLQNWLQYLPIPWWGVALAYPAFVLLLDILLCLIFGGRARLRELLSDRVLFYWLVLVPGAISVVYIANWRATSAAISSLAQNGIDVLAWRHYSLVYTSDWLQWPILVSAFVLVLSSCRRYAVVRREKTAFAKQPWPVYLLRSVLTDLPAAYMVCMTVISLVDSTITLYRVFTHIPSIVAVDSWHPDGLYGLKPAYKLLLGQFGVGLLVSFLPTLMLLREAEQPYSNLYRAGVLIGIATVIVIASIVMYDFSNAMEWVRLSAITAAVDGLQAFQTPSASLIQAIRRTNLLIEYQIAESLPVSLPIPGWLKALGISRTSLLAVELYSLLQPVLGTPKVPDILRRMIKVD